MTTTDVLTQLGEGAALVGAIAVTVAIIAAVDKFVHRAKKKKP